VGIGLSQDTDSAIRKLAESHWSLVGTSARSDLAATLFD
jgi:hypothetical protein